MVNFKPCGFANSILSFISYSLTINTVDAYCFYCRRLIHVLSTFIVCIVDIYCLYCRNILSLLFILSIHIVFIVYVLFLLFILFNRRSTGQPKNEIKSHILIFKPARLIVRLVDKVNSLTVHFFDRTNNIKKQLNQTHNICIYTCIYIQ